MRKQNSVFKTAFTSEADKNLKNTDSFGYVELDKYACYVIADGIDDQVDGMSAKLAVDTIISAFTEAPSMRKGALRRYLRSANKALLTADSKMRLKASVTVVVTNYVKMRYGQAGNTRFRLYRDGFLRAQSRDQSLSMDLVKAEKLEPDKLTQHQERHNLYCYLGQDKDFRPFISKKLKLSDSDAAALMTRGVWEHLDDGLLKDAFADASDEPQETVDAVEDLLLSMQPKDLGAYTFATIFFNKTYNDPNRKRKIKRAIMIAIPIILVLVVVAVILAVYFHNRQKKIDSMEQSFYDTIEYIQADNYVRAKEECQKALDLAEGLSDKEIQEDAGNYMKLIESVIAGDDALTGGEYSDAQRNFLNARNRTRYADNLGLDYIDDRLEQTSQYMSVYELISLGDTLAQGQQYDKAEEQYLTAKALAAQLYFDTGRDDAMAALEQMYADQSEQQAQEDEKAQETAQAQTAAASVLAEGDAAFSKGDYCHSNPIYYTDPSGFSTPRVVHSNNPEVMDILQSTTQFLQGVSGERVGAIPSRENFNTWFDSLTVDQLKVLMTDNTVNDRITDRLRLGDRHEWLMVSNAAIAKSWGLSAYDIQTLTNYTSELYFLNVKNAAGVEQSGFHTGTPGSSAAHMGPDGINELMRTSSSFDEFKLRLNVWADEHLVLVTDVGISRGRQMLPGGLIVTDAELENYKATGTVGPSSGLNPSPRAAYTPN